MWLAARGWQALAVDFSAVALERAATIAQERLGPDAGRLATERADLTTYRPGRTFDLALVVYLQLPAEQRAAVLRTAAACVAPGGRLVVVAHHSDNLSDGVGGPQSPAALYTEQDVLDDLAGAPSEGFVVERADRVLRPVGDRQAVDALVVLRRG